MKIIRDTREQKGYSFAFFDDIEVISRKLDYGDYSLEDGSITIERKANSAELYMNLATKSEKGRFYRELEQLQHLKKPIILCEFPEEHIYTFPMGSYIPPTRWKNLRINAYYFSRLVEEIRSSFPKIQMIFNENKYAAETKLVELFREQYYGETTQFDF